MSSKLQLEKDAFGRKAYEPPVLIARGNMASVTKKSGSRPDNEQQFDRPKHDPADGPPGQDRKPPKSRS
jgi:hypothetical protein